MLLRLRLRRWTPVFSACCTDRGFDRAPRARPSASSHSHQPASPVRSAVARLSPALLPFHVLPALELPQDGRCPKLGRGGGGRGEQRMGGWWLCSCGRVDLDPTTPGTEALTATCRPLCSLRSPSPPCYPIPVPLSLPSRCVLSLALAPVSCLPSAAACVLRSLDDPAIRPGCAEYDLSIVGNRSGQWITTLGFNATAESRAECGGRRHRTLLGLCSCFSTLCLLFFLPLVSSRPPPALTHNPTPTHRSPCPRLAPTLRVSPPASVS